MEEGWGMTEKIRVILVTDGDRCAQRAVEEFEAQGARAVLDAVRAAGDERPLA